MEAEARVFSRAPPRAADRVPRRADERRRSNHAPSVLAAHLRSRARRNDGARDDALHGRSRVLRSDLDHGGGEDRGVGNTGGVEETIRCRLDRRSVRATRAADERECGRMNALWGLLRKETYHILRDRRTLAV